MTQPITAWLNAPDEYDTGLALLEQTGFAGFALTVLRMGEDAYNRKRIVAELTAWLDRQTETPEAAPVIPAKPDPAPVVVVPPVAVDTSVARLIDGVERQIYPLMDERAALKSQIWAVMGDDMRQGDRRDWAYRIKRITRAIDDLYSQIEFVKQYGYAPPSADPAPDVDDATALANARTYVSRYKKKLATAKTDTQRTTAQAMLTQWTDTKNSLELKLGKA